MTGYRLDTQIVEGAETLVVIIEGPLDFESSLALLREADARQPSRLIVDASKFRPDFIGPRQVRKLAAVWRDSSVFRSAWVAAVAPSPVVYGLCLLFQWWVKAEGRFAVFRSHRAALNWLHGRDAKH